MVILLSSSACYERECSERELAAATGVDAAEMGQAAMARVLVNQDYDSAMYDMSALSNVRQLLQVRFEENINIEQQRYRNSSDARPTWNSLPVAAGWHERMSTLVRISSTTNTQIEACTRLCAISIAITLLSFCYVGVAYNRCSPTLAHGWRARVCTSL